MRFLPRPTALQQLSEWFRASGLEVHQEGGGSVGPRRNHIEDLDRDAAEAVIGLFLPPSQKGLV